jgi:hypothetical protein
MSTDVGLFAFYRQIRQLLRAQLVISMSRSRSLDLEVSISEGRVTFRSPAYDHFPVESHPKLSVVSASRLVWVNRVLRALDRLQKTSLRAVTVANDLMQLGRRSV